MAEARPQLRSSRARVLVDPMLIEASFNCAVCGEENPTTVDTSAGRQQAYIEDCQVCCRPNTLRIESDIEFGFASIAASFEE